MTQRGEENLQHENKQVEPEMKLRENEESDDIDGERMDDEDDEVETEVGAERDREDGKQKEENKQEGEKHAPSARNNFNVVCSDKCVTTASK
jgi:hypothetical protein